MDRNYFTDEDIEILSKNKYVKKVTNKTISFTKEFKELFIEESNTGKGPTRIFVEQGFNPYILGSNRIKKFSGRIKRKGRSSGKTRDCGASFCQKSCAGAKDSGLPTPAPGYFAKTI